MSQAVLVPGAVIQGRYELRRLLGQGGMGSVWVAWHRGLKVDVALKFIDAPEGNQEDLLARFSREASAVARIKSPHVVSVMDHGYDEQHGLPFLAMEMLSGESLGDRLDRERQLPLRDTVEIVRQALRGLTKAHEAQIIHRDLKPDNLFLCQDDELLVKILDFGIAKTGSASGMSVSTAQRTQTGALLGTPYYMSPEQTMGTKAIDHRSDLYAMGVVAFYCLAGTPPFVSEGLGELIMMINSQPPPSMSHFRTDIPAPVEQWLMRSLAKSPGARFQDAKQMSAALVLAFEQSSGLSLGPSSAGGSGHAGVSTPVMPGKQARHGSVPDQWADEDDRTHVATPGGLPSTQKPAATVGAGPLATAATIADTPVGLRAPGGSFFQEKPSTLDGSSTASESRPQATVPLRWVLGGVAALAVTGVSAALTWSALSDKPAATSTAAAVSATASAAAPATSASAEPSTAPSSSAAKPVDINSLPASAAGAAGKTDTSGGRKSSKKDATPEKKDPPVEKPAPAEKPAETTEPPKKKNSKWD